MRRKGPARKSIRKHPPDVTDEMRSTDSTNPNQFFGGELDAIHSLGHDMEVELGAPPQHLLVERPLSSSRPVEFGSHHGNAHTLSLHGSRDSTLGGSHGAGPTDRGSQPSLPPQ